VLDAFTTSCLALGFYHGQPSPQPLGEEEEQVHDSFQGYAPYAEDYPPEAQPEERYPPQERYPPEARYPPEDRSDQRYPPEARSEERYSRDQRDGDGNPTPYTLHPTPYTLHPKHFTLHPTPYTLHPKHYTLHPAPRTLHPTTKPCLGPDSAGGPNKLSSGGWRRSAPAS